MDIPLYGLGFFFFFFSPITNYFPFKFVSGLEKACDFLLLSYILEILFGN